MNINKWTFKNSKKEALKYKTRMEFKAKCSPAYIKSVRNKWLNDVCSHMEILIHPKGYWTFEKCEEEASKHKWRKDFAKSKGWAYNTALNNKWLDEICKHMNVCGNLKKRCIYAYEFPDNRVYIGLTFNYEQRWVKRLKDKNDIVTKYLKISKKYPIRKQLTDYIEVSIARKLEGEYVEIYRKNGWEILNRNVTGSLGGNILKWTYDKCKEEASKYKSMKQLKKHNPLCLVAIYKNGWYKDILSNLKYTKMPNNYWTKEKCQVAAKLCKSKLEFYKKYRGAYAASKLNNWFEEICNIIDGDRK